MKAIKKQKKILPEVHILGDLEDAKILVSGINKKKTLIVFKDGEQGILYSEIEGEINQIAQEEIAIMEKDHRLIFFSFFPSQKKVIPVIEESPVVQEPEKEEKKDEECKKEKKVKKEKKSKKQKKSKKKKSKK
jgi:hypothetical protein